MDVIIRMQQIWVESGLIAGKWKVFDRKEEDKFTTRVRRDIPRV